LRGSALPGVADQIEATIVWMRRADAAGRPYWLKIGAKQVVATITALSTA